MNGIQLTSWEALKAGIVSSTKAMTKWLVTNPVGWAILGGTAILGLVKAYDALNISIEECKERTDELMSSYKTALDTANSNASKVEELASKYETLSKGVNKLGKNVSLTTEEYAEYNSIVNDIAGMFPTLISGYTDEGTAILSLKGNVEELRDAYKEAQQESYNMLIVSGEDSDGNDIINNFDNQVFGKESALSKVSSFIDGEAGAKDVIDIITRLTGALTPDEFRDTYNKLYEEYENIWNSNKIKDALNSSGIDDLTHAGDWGKITNEDLANIKQSAQATIQTYQAEINSALLNVQTLANAYLMTNDDYSSLDEQSKSIASQIVNTLDENIASSFDNKESVGAYVQSILDVIKDNPDAKDAMLGLFTTDLSEMSPSNAKEIVDQYINKIAEVLGEDALELKIRLGFDDTDDLATKYENAIKTVQDKFGTEETDFFTKNSINTTEEIDNWLECAEAANSAADAEQRYLSIGKDDETPIQFNFDNFSSAIKDLSSIESLYNNFKKSIETNDGIRIPIDASSFEGLSDAIKELDSFDSLRTLLSDSTSSTEDIQRAFNGLSTEFIYTSDCLNGLDTSNRSLIVSQLELQGITNASTIITEELALACEEASNAGISLESILNGEADSFLNMSNLSDTAKQSLAQFTLAKLTANGTTLDTSGDIQNLINLVSTLGGATTALQAFNSLKNGNIQSGMSKEDYDAIKSNAQKEIQNSLSNMTMNQGISAASKAGKETADAYLKSFEKELARLKDLKDRGEVTEKQYLDKLLSLNRTFFKNKQKYAEQYEKYQYEVLNGYKTLYESVFSHASKVLDKQISVYNKQKDAAIDSYNAQKKAAEDYYKSQIKNIDTQIKAKQNEIDAIKQANEERNLQLELEKAIYEQDRLKNQKTIREYAGADKGIIYKTDTEKLKDAEDNVISKKEEIQIANIEKTIDALNRQKDTLQEMLDNSNAYWDSMIESTENYFNALTEKLEGSKSRWEELSEIAEQAEIQAKLSELGLTEQDILSMSDDAFNSLKTTYLNVLADMYRGNDQMMQQLSSLSGVDMSSLTGYIEQTSGLLDGISQIDLTGVTGGIDNMTSALNATEDAVGKVSSAIGGASSGNGKEEGNGSNNQGKEGSSGGNSLQSAISNQTADANQKIPEETARFNELSNEVLNGTTQVIALSEEINNLPTEKTITIKVKTEYSGGSPSLPAHADGVTNLKHDELAWTQEEGREIIISPSSKAMMTPLQKGDSVLTNKVTENLIKWGGIDPSVLAKHINPMQYINLNIPDYSKLMQPRMQEVTVHQDINVTIPNLDGESAFHKFENSLNQMKMDALQRSYRM